MRKGEAVDGDISTHKRRVVARFTFQGVQHALHPTAPLPKTCEDHFAPGDDPKESWWHHDEVKYRTNNYWASTNLLTCKSECIFEPNKPSWIYACKQKKQRQEQMKLRNEYLEQVNDYMYSICMHIGMERPCAYHNNRPSSYQQWKYVCVLEWICVLEQNRWHAAYYRPHSSDSNITDLLNKDATISETTLFLPFSNFIWTPPTQQMEPISIMQSHPSLLKLSQIHLGVLSCWASGDKLWWAEGVKVEGSRFN